MILEGLPYFISPTSMRRWMLHMVEMRADLLRRSGLLLMVAGLSLIYWVRG